MSSSLVTAMGERLAANNNNIIKACLTPPQRVFFFFSPQVIYTETESHIFLSQLLYAEGKQQEQADLAILQNTEAG